MNTEHETQFLHDFSARNHLFFQSWRGRLSLTDNKCKILTSVCRICFLLSISVFFRPPSAAIFAAPHKIFGAKYFQNSASFSNPKNILDKRMGLAKLHPPGRQLQIKPPSRNPLASCRPADVQSKEIIYVAV